MIFGVIVTLLCYLGSIVSISIKISIDSPIKNPSEIRLEKAEDFYNLVGFLANDSRYNDSYTFLKNAQIDEKKMPRKSLILNVENQNLSKKFVDLFTPIEVSKDFGFIDNKQIPDETKWINVDYNYDLSNLDKSRVIFLIVDNNLTVNGGRNIRGSKTIEPFAQKSTNKQNDEIESLENTIYWLVYLFFALIVFIVILILDMDPGYDSIIYRISNIRSKKDT